MAGTEGNKTEPEPISDPEPEPEPTKEPEPEPKADPDGGELTDKHGEPAINRERYEREMKTANDRIADLEGKLKEASETKERGESLKGELEKVKADFSDKELTYKLELAGCVDAKAAKARLDDFDGDVDKLKESCPYLFKQRKTGSTGFAPGGSTGKEDERVRNARAAAGLKPKE